LAWPTDPSQSWRGLAAHTFPFVLLPFAAPVAVSTETPLLALQSWGDRYSDLVVTLRNHDAVNRAALYVEQSESGVVNDDDRETLYVPALKERTIEFRDALRLWWGLAGSGDPEAAFPSVQVSFQVLARIRSQRR
jgi:hypothetical protein